MKFVYFTHSLASCWNHGNAHFLRGVLRELVYAGHEVIAYEPRDSWSMQNLLKDHGEAGRALFEKLYPELNTLSVESTADLDSMLDGADGVIVHEWNDPQLVSKIGNHRKRAGRYILLFHDTHHRAVSDPAAIKRFDLSGYDGVLAFGEALAEVYRKWGWGNKVFVWHEAADTRLFRPPQMETRRRGLVWIGNWGDDERTTELETFLLRPAAYLRLSLDIYGVRYPAHARELLTRYGATYCGWLANPEAPRVFARHMATVHVPRRFYVSKLPGIPTIRVFEALACGIPLISAPWNDAEGLFHANKDFLMAKTEEEMVRHLRDVSHDADLRKSLVENGLAAIEARHTCRHRAIELLSHIGKFASEPGLEIVA